MKKRNFVKFTFFDFFLVSKLIKKVYKIIKKKYTMKENNK